MGKYSGRGYSIEEQLEMSEEGSFVIINPSLPVGGYVNDDDLDNASYMVALSTHDLDPKDEESLQSAIDIRNKKLLDILVSYGYDKEKIKAEFWDHEEVIEPSELNWHCKESEEQYRMLLRHKGRYFNYKPVGPADKPKQVKGKVL